VAVVTTAAAVRHVIGTFQITIPVRTKEVLLAPEQRLLSNLRSIELAIPKRDRWYLPSVATSPDCCARGWIRRSFEHRRTITFRRSAASDSDERDVQVVRTNDRGSVGDLIALGAIGGATPIVLSLLVLALLLVASYLWIKNCRPGGIRLLITAVVGVVVGIIFYLRLRTIGR
jgi:hypothetical protein